MDFQPIKKVKFEKEAQLENDAQSEKDAKLEKETKLVNETQPENNVQLEEEVQSEKGHAKKETQLQREAYFGKETQLEIPVQSGNVASVEQFPQSLDNAVSLESSDVAVSSVVGCDSDAVNDSVKKVEEWLQLSQQNIVNETSVEIYQGSTEMKLQNEGTAVESAKLSVRLLPEEKGTDNASDCVKDTCSKTYTDAAEVRFNSASKRGELTGRSEEKTSINKTSAIEDTSITTAFPLKSPTDRNVAVPVEDSVGISGVSEGEVQEKNDANDSNTMEYVDGVLHEVTTDNESLSVSDFKPFVASEFQRNNETAATTYLANQFNQIAQANQSGFQKEESVCSCDPSFNQFQKSRKFKQSDIKKEEVLTASKSASSDKTYGQFHEIQQSNRSVICNELPTTCTGVSAQSYSSDLNYVGETLAKGSENNEQETAIAERVNFTPATTAPDPTVGKPQYISVVKSFCALHSGSSIEEPIQSVVPSVTLSTVAARATHKPLEPALNSSASHCLKEDDCDSFTSSSKKKHITSYQSTSGPDQYKSAVEEDGNSDMACESDQSECSSWDDVLLSQRLDYNESHTTTTVKLKSESQQLPKAVPPLTAEEDQTVEVRSVNTRPGETNTPGLGEEAHGKAGKDSARADAVWVETSPSKANFEVHVCEAMGKTNVPSFGNLIISATAETTVVSEEETNSLVDVVTVDTDGSSNTACVNITCAVDAGRATDDNGVVKATYAADGSGVVDTTCVVDEADDNGVAKATCAADGSGVVKATCAADGSGATMDATCVGDVTTAADDIEVVKATCAADGSGVANTNCTVDTADDNGVAKATCAADGSGVVKATRAADGSGVVGANCVGDVTTAADDTEVAKATCAADGSGVVNTNCTVDMGRAADDNKVVKAACAEYDSGVAKATGAADGSGVVKATCAADGSGLVDATCAIDVTSAVDGSGVKPICAADKASVAKDIRKLDITCGVDGIGMVKTTSAAHGSGKVDATGIQASSNVTNAVNTATAMAVMEKSDGGMDIGNVARVSSDLDISVEDLLDVMDFSDSQLIRTAAMAADTAQQSELFAEQTPTVPQSHHVTTEGCEMIDGLVKELSALNQYVMQTKREVDTLKKQRQMRIKTFKTKKTLNK